MISFNLKCSNSHEFEGWFSSSDDFERQCKEGLVSCPICDDTSISKALMTPNLGTGSSLETTPNAPDDAAPSSPQKQGQFYGGKSYAVLRALKKKIEAECDFVGDRFAEEARKIHYGESAVRGIYGQSSPEDAEALEDEGIEIAPIPWLPPEN